MSSVEKRRAERRSASGSATTRLRPIIVIWLLFTAFAATILFGAVDPISTGLLAIAAAVTLLLWVAESWKSAQLAINLDELYLPIVGLIVIGIIQMLPLRGDPATQGLLSIPLSSSLSLDPHATRMFTVRLVIMLVFFAAASTFIDSKKKIVNCALAIVVFGAAMAFFAILQRMSGTDAIYGLRRSAQAIAFGPFVNQHHFAAFMVMTSGLTLGMLIGRGVAREWRLFLAIAAVLMGIGVIFTGSRGGLLSYGGVIAVTALLSYLKLRDSDRGESRVGRMAALAGGAAMFVSVIAVAFFLGAGEALFRGLGPDQSDITSGRSHFWGVAWQIFTDHPFIGAGFDAFGVAFTRYDTWAGIYRIEQAHNDYLQTLADGGVLAFVCIAAFIYLFARKSLTAIARSTDEMRTNVAIGAFAGCVGIMIHSIFDFPLRTPSNSIFFLLLVVLACAWVEKEGGPSKRRRKSRAVSEL
ncbi:MAG: O-antigen ligase family protein [Acidobacteriota bacterium]